MTKKPRDKPSGLVIRGPNKDLRIPSLFHEDDLIGAADEVHLSPVEGVSVKDIADELSRRIPVALGFGLTSSVHASRGDRIEHLERIIKGADSLLRALGVAGSVNPDRISLDVLDLLRPGFAGPQALSPGAAVIALAGGLGTLRDAGAMARELAEAAGCNGEDPAVAERQAFDRKLTEGALRALPQILSVLDAAARQAKSVIAAEEGRIGRHEEEADRLVLLELARAHKQLFGFDPQLRDRERGRDTPSVRWVKAILECGAARAPVIMGVPGDLVAPEVERFVALSTRAVATLNNKLGGALPGN